MNQSARVVSVEILGQHYPIRSTLDGEYIAKLAAYVDEKIRSTAEVTPTSDTVRLVVLAALNIADEFFHARSGGRNALVASRLAHLEQVVDEAMADRTDNPAS